MKLICILAVLFCFQTFADHADERPFPRYTCSAEEARKLQSMLKDIKDKKEVDKEEFHKLVSKIPKECLTGDLRADAEHVLTKLGYFPCDLSSLKDTEEKRQPEIHLAGQNHDCRKCKAIEAKQLARMKQGEALFGQEGLVYRKPKDREAKIEGRMGIGVEDQSRYSLSQFFKARVELLEKAKKNLAFDPDASLEFVLQVFVSYEHLAKSKEVSQAWKNARKANPKLKNDDDEEVASLLDALVAGHPNPDMDKFIDKVKRIAPLKSAITRVNELIAPELLKVLDTDDKKKELDLPDLASVRAMVKDVTDMKSYEKFLDVFAVDWRNEEVFGTYAKLFCEAAESGKDLEASLGTLHLRGMMPMLRSGLDRSGGKAIKIKVDRDYLTHDHFTAAIDSGNKETDEYLKKERELIKKFFDSLKD